MSRSLNLMFEEQYMELRDAVDVIAERIRALGHVAPASHAEPARLSPVIDEEGSPEAMEMVRRLVRGHEGVIRTARSLVKLAEGANDMATADPATQRVDVYEKTASMLRATAS